MEEEGREWRERSLDELVAESIGFTGDKARKAELELQRRQIAESVRASRRLLVATWVIAALTVVLIVLTVAAIIAAAE